MELERTNQKDLLPNTTHYQKTRSQRSSTTGSRLTHKQHTTNNQSTFGLSTHNKLSATLQTSTSTVDSIIKQQYQPNKALPQSRNDTFENDLEKDDDGKLEKEKKHVTSRITAT
jgi:hypothetical protein